MYSLFFLVFTFSAVDLYMSLVEGVLVFLVFLSNLRVDVMMGLFVSFVSLHLLFYTFGFTHWLVKGGTSFFLVFCLLEGVIIWFCFILLLVLVLTS